MGVPTDLSFGVTAGCVMVIAGAAISLIVYATLIFVGLLPTASAQALSGLAF